MRKKSIHFPRSVKFLDTEKFIELFESFIRNSYRGKRTKTNGVKIKNQTADNYGYTLKLLKEFTEGKRFELRLYLVSNLNSKELQKAQSYWQEFYDSFTEFLYNEKEAFDNYVGFNIKHIRAFMNYVKKDLLIPVGDFHMRFYVPKEDISIVALKPEQLHLLIYDKTLDEQLSERLRKIKDVFVFGCAVALRFSDLMALKTHNWKKDMQAHYIEVISKKTHTASRIKIPDYAIKILLKYKSRRQNLLPTYSKGYFNRQLKELGSFISNSDSLIKTRMRRGKQVMIYRNIKSKKHYTMADHLTSHTMRRTGITNLLRMGVPEQLVRQISGHAANSPEFHKYVAHSQTYHDQEMDRAFKKFSEMSF